MVWWKKKSPEQVRREEMAKHAAKIKAKEEAEDAKYSEKFKVFDDLKAEYSVKFAEYKVFMKKELDALSEEILAVEGFKGARHYADLVKGMEVSLYGFENRYYYNSGYEKMFLVDPDTKKGNPFYKDHYDRLKIIHEQRLKTAIPLPFWVDENILTQDEDEEVLRRLPFGSMNIESVKEKIKELSDLTRAIHRARCDIPIEVRVRRMGL